MVAKFLGIQYPFVTTARGTLAQKSGVDQIKADLLQLLLTNPGERVMMPEFGTPLKKLFFEPNEEILEVEARRVIADSINRWEPRIVINNIQVTSKVDPMDLNPLDDSSEREAILMIKIAFVDPENIQQIEHLELGIPLGG